MDVRDLQGGCLAFFLIGPSLDGSPSRRFFQNHLLLIRGVLVWSCGLWFFLLTGEVETKYGILRFIFLFPCSSFNFRGAVGSEVWNRMDRNDAFERHLWSLEMIVGNQLVVGMECNS